MTIKQIPHINNTEKHNSHAADLKTVCEGADAELLEKGGLTRENLGASLDQMHIVQDLDGSLCDLGVDVQGLEEVGLSGLKSGHASGHVHVHGGNNTSAGGGTDLSYEASHTRERER